MYLMQKWLRYAHILTAGLCAVFWIGCGGGETGSPCEQDADCLAPLVCTSGQCREKSTEKVSGSEKSASDGGPDTLKDITPEQRTDARKPVKVTKLEGDGSSKKVVFHGPYNKPDDAKEAQRRFQKTWVLHGENLDRLTGIKLELIKDSTTVFEKNDGLDFEEGGSSTMRTIRLPKTLVAGLFALIGLIGTQQVTLAQVYVLQGEPGKDGTDGTTGASGKNGSNGTSCSVDGITKDKDGNTVVSFKCGSQNSKVTISRGVKGDIGPKGTTGPQGPKGDPGKGVKIDHIGTFAGIKNVSTPKVGETYLVNDSGNSKHRHMYVYNGSSFIDAGPLAGVPGPRGPQGLPGPKGNAGPKGDVGSKGDTGPRGPQGLKGDTGSKGTIGPQGPRGDKGAAGAQGPQGPKGDTGARGLTGPQGLQGPKGNTGVAGAKGDPGPQGPKGDKGLKGDIGPQGPKGDKGATGAQGPQGLKGAIGPKGDKGATGPQGLRGVTGLQGPKGDTGLRGLQGIQGAVGATGPQGLRGVTGAQGVKGDPGPGFNTATLTFVNGLMSLMTVNTGTKLIQVKNANLQIINGLNKTDSTNGVGNLIIGYNETRTGAARTGSHNLVVGPRHAFTKYGGIVAGNQNNITGNYSSVLSGINNTASGIGSAILSGNANKATGNYAGILSGSSNTASGLYSGIVAGALNTASGTYSSCVSGSRNTASSGEGVIVGGRRNEAKTGVATVVLGGFTNAATGNDSTICGGQQNIASGMTSSISGGANGRATAQASTVSGGNGYAATTVTAHGP
jgi:hypothetical protein